MGRHVLKHLKYRWMDNFREEILKGKAQAERGEFSSASIDDIDNRVLKINALKAEIDKGRRDFENGNLSDESLEEIAERIFKEIEDAG